MDTSKFSADSPGKIVAISDPESEHGSINTFLPDDLPPKWSFPEGLWPLLAEAGQQLGILEGLGRNLPNPGILLRPLEDREALKSSQLEGTYATARELLLYEMTPRDSMSEGDPANRQREVFNYRRALHEAVNTKLPLSLRLVKQLHATLMHGVRGKDRSPGEFRRIQVAIGEERRFVPPPAHRVMECLSPMERYFHMGNPQFKPLVDCFLIHYQFETIHPFVDGNGRVGRLLLAVMLMERCQLSKPWLYMSEYFEGNREEYAERLFNVSAQGDWEGWIRFCLRGAEQQARDTIERCERLRAIREDYIRRLGEIGGSTRLNKIVEDIFSYPFVRIADLPKRLGRTYPTAKADVERLVSAGILRELNGVSPKTFYAPEIFNVAYDNVD